VCNSSLLLNHLKFPPVPIAGLTICGADCLLSAEWKSSNKIIARIGRAKGVGDIIVQTKSGGVGTATVQFRGYNVQIGKEMKLYFGFVLINHFLLTGLKRSIAYKMQ
jgi:hypothetical protein